MDGQFSILSIHSNLENCQREDTGEGGTMTLITLCGGSAYHTVAYPQQARPNMQTTLWGYIVVGIKERKKERKKRERERKKRKRERKKENIT